MIPRSSILLLAIIVSALRPSPAGAQTFTLQAVKSYPFPNELAASARAARIAWAFNEEGRRNIYVAEGPQFEPRKLTAYNEDDGQELTGVSLSPNGEWVVYVRGGDHGSNWSDDVPVNVGPGAALQKVQVWAVPFSGGEARALGEGDDPLIAPSGDSVVFIRGGQAWIAPIGGDGPARNLFTTQGTTGSLAFAPDGGSLAFVSNRSDHSLIGVYRFASSTIRWIAPSFKRDNHPRWSPDSKRLAFIRTPGAGGPPDSLLGRRHQPWSVWTADVASGMASELYKSPRTLTGSIPTTHGGYNLHWAAGDRVVFLSYLDGWPHLYSIPAGGGAPMLLTPGAFMAEHITLSPDRQWLYFAANTGTEREDIDRRHVARVRTDRPGVELLTPGQGLEWAPVALGDGQTVALISATARRPPLPAVLSLAKGDLKLLGENRIPASFPSAALTVPKIVTFQAPDGATVHAQLFEGAGGGGKRPAVIYVHGGPMRQMLLGWHYSDYYANAYATNQYLASQGFTVLSVNYRLGIGYGHAFHHPQGGGRAGASEYGDVRAAALWLAARPGVDRERIGIYGGSYGGYLTALALARDSKLFAAGVDIHGVHDWTAPGRMPPPPVGYEKVPDLDSATRIAYLSSPVSAVKHWTSPVLVIHADDDRNVAFSQSTDLVKRLERQGVPLETLVIVGDTHHWMKHEHAVAVDGAIADFFVRRLGKK